MLNSSRSTCQAETSELILLNSSRYIRIALAPPTGKDPVIMSLYANSDECIEPGEIGCNYLNEVKDVRWQNFKIFDINEDEQVVRELPLPSKVNKQEESDVMAADTTLANVTPMISIPSPRLFVTSFYLFICLHSPSLSLSLCLSVSLSLSLSLSVSLSLSLSLSLFLSLSVSVSLSLSLSLSHTHTHIL